MKEKCQEVKELQIIFLSVLVLGALIIAPTHIFPQPYFMYARFPHYLEMMGPFLGMRWPGTFEIYHRVLYLLAAIISLNGLGLVFFPKFKKLTIFSSILGIIMFSLMVLFFFLKFVSVNTPDAVVIGLYSLILLIMEIMISAALTKQKGVKRARS